MLSLLLWCLVVDELIAGLNGGDVYTQGYVDDICLPAVGKYGIRTHTMGPSYCRNMV